MEWYRGTETVDPVTAHGTILSLLRFVVAPASGRHHSQRRATGDPDLAARRDRRCGFGRAGRPRDGRQARKASPPQYYAC